VDDLRAVDFGELAGDLLVSLPADARDLVDALGGVLRQLVAEIQPHRARLDVAVGRADRALDGEFGVEVELDAHGWSCCPSRSPSDPGAVRRVPSASCMTNTFSGRSASTLSPDTSRAEELPGVLADEQRHVRLLF